jgi:hypothetical protein
MGVMNGGDVCGVDVIDKGIPFIAVHLAGGDLAVGGDGRDQWICILH